MSEKTNNSNKKQLLKHPKGSIYSQGYGTIAKMVMLDKGLTIEAKAIYAYLCSFMGAGDTAFPSVKKICYDLGISKDRYYKHINYLVCKGYLTINHMHYTATGQKANNQYVLNQTLPCP